MTDSIYIRGLKSFAIPADAPIIEIAVSKLRNAIMMGELRPGQKLVEAELCNSLNISRASLREALRALESERLIELIPNRGPSVARLGYREVEEIHDVWSLLTGAAVYDFTAAAEPADFEKLDEALGVFREAIQENTPLKQLAATNSFFMAILSKCGNSVLTEMIISLVSRVNFLRAQSLLYQNWGVLYATEIEDIVSAIKSRSPEAARDAARKHIASACVAAKQLAASAELEAKDKLKGGKRSNQNRKAKEKRKRAATNKARAVS